MVLFIWDRRILGALKACITYPRTGYVQPPGDPVVSPHDPIIRLSNPPPSLIEENVTWFRNRTVMVLFMGFSFQMMVQGPWSLAAMMAAVAISLYALNRNIEHPYTWWSVMPLGIAGLPFHWLQIPQKVQELMPLLLGGAWLLVRGLWTFVGYLRQNPLPREGRFSIE